MWPFGVGQVASNELEGRSFLPRLKDLLLAPCFRNESNYHDQELRLIQEAKASVQSCLTSATTHYGYLLMGVAAIVSFVYIIRAGYAMFTAFGDEAKYAQGKKTLLYAVIGLAIAIASGFIINFVVGVLGYAGPNPFNPAP
ncbi:MAG: pilin [bacterium]|nr:pilin [bacterium]